MNDNYSAASGQGIYAGRFNLAPWIVSAPDEQWGIVPFSNKMADINPENNPLINPNFPSASPFKGDGGWVTKITAWNGQCASPDGVLWHICDGGHADTGDNSIVKADINTASPSWVLVRKPSGAIGNVINLNDGLENTGLYADGRPRSVHTYSTPVYFEPTKMPMLGVLGKTCYRSGQGGTDRPVGISEQTGEMILFGAVAPTGVGMGLDNSACYDKNRQLIWYKGSGNAKLGTYDPTTNVWQLRGNGDNTSGTCSICYLPDHDVILIFCGFYTNGFVVFDCTTYQYFTPAVTGSFTGMAKATIGQCQGQYLGGNKVAFWNNDTDTTKINVLTFTGNPRSSTWSIGTLNLSPSNSVTPTVKTPAGVFNRFRWLPKLGIFTLINAVNQDMYFFKPRL